MILIPLMVLASVPQSTPAVNRPTVPCPATSAPPPHGLEGWSRKQPARAGATAKAATILLLGVGVAATLLPTPKIAYAVRPEKPGDPTSRGGMFTFAVATAGRHRVALGSAAWIDVVRGTTSAQSVAHGHGPDCTGVRKMVDFDLKPGRYLLQVAGSATATLPMLITRMP